MVASPQGMEMTSFAEMPSRSIDPVEVIKTSGGLGRA